MEFLMVIILGCILPNLGWAQAPTLSSSCIGCHGVAGLSPNPLWPNLAGQKKEYLAKQMLAFKSGERQDPLMNPVAQALSAKDIDELASYFANIKNSSQSNK